MSHVSSHLTSGKAAFATVTTSVWTAAERVIAAAKAVLAVAVIAFCALGITFVAAAKANSTAGAIVFCGIGVTLIAVSGAVAYYYFLSTCKHSAASVGQSMTQAAIQWIVDTVSALLRRKPPEEG